VAYRVVGSMGLFRGSKLSIYQDKNRSFTCLLLVGATGFIIRQAEKAVSNIAEINEEVPLLIWSLR
jgi:hypothetical protein